jgi:hypothetical protein
MSKKSILLIVLLAVVLNVFYNSNFIEVRSHEKYSNELGELLSQKYFSNKIIGKQYTVSQIIQTNDPLFKILKEKGIINNQSYFSYSSAGCISLVTRKSKKLFGGFSDILITRNEKGEEFLCGINAVYSLNNDENAEVLNIKCYNLAGHMTLAFIST